MLEISNPKLIKYRLLCSRPKGGWEMQINLALEPIISLIAGILILAQPRLLNYIVAIYLIVIGILGIAN